MLSVTIEISGDKEVIKKLGKIRSEFEDWKPELTKIGDFLKDFYSNAVFESEGAVFNSRWQPLKPAYELWKRKHFPGRGILERSGSMRKGFITDIDSNSMELHNKMFYHVYHQQGKGVPKRVLAQLDQPRKDAVVKLFRDAIIGKIRKATT